MPSQSANLTLQRALISVSDKRGLPEFAKALVALGIELISTGGTASYLQQHGIAVKDVAEVTGFPEIMAGRVKTLHPNIHAAILARPQLDDAVLAEHHITAIDLIVVNLYPFVKVTADPNCSWEQAIETIDIGGPTMVRAAAKNYLAKTVVVDPGDYAQVLAELSTNQGAISVNTRFALATKAFQHTAQYDLAISNYFQEHNRENTFPQQLTLNFSKKSELRYGENPHQAAAFYQTANPASGTVAASRLFQGKDLSFNNIADADAALNCVKAFTDPACVIVKHANPCGVAVAGSLTVAYQNAYKTDPTSSFGGIIAFNGQLDAVTAKQIIEQQFVEVIVAPEIAADALTILQTKAKIRVLACGKWENPSNHQLNFKQISGGLLVQDSDNKIITAADLKIVSKRQPTADEIRDCLFAWQVVKHVKSNAIVYAKNNTTIGIGAGQMSRVYSAKIAAIKANDANLLIAGSVMASDAFFPFRDGIDTAAVNGITAVIQPGGSIRDDEVIAAADEANLAMVFTGIRHFLH